jgi:hypothetical protein
LGGDATMTFSPAKDDIYTILEQLVFSGFEARVPNFFSSYDPISTGDSRN